MTGDRDSDADGVHRRSFLQAVAGTGAAATLGPGLATARPGRSPPETDDAAPADFVNPFVGTDWFVQGGVHRGNTVPAATRPFGLAQVGPDTAGPDGGAQTGYAYDDTAIEGFSHTHLSGTGCSGYGHFLLTATTGPVATEESEYRSAFDHEHEQAEPGYYAVRLADYDVYAELTASKRAGVHRYTFPETDEGHVLLDVTHHVEGNYADPEHGDAPEETPADADDHVTGSVEIRPGENAVVGEATLQQDFCGASDPYTAYFYAKFETPFDGYGVWSDDLPDGGVRRGATSASGEDVGAVLDYATAAGEEVQAKVGISFVSVEGARRNLDSEVPDWDFDAVREEAHAEWNEHLGRFEIEGGTPAERQTFYSALYHSLLYPQVFEDADGRYAGMDGEIHTADGYTQHATFSLWDTFRSLTPLLILGYPERQRDFVSSLLSHYETGGWLPKWSLANVYTNTMVGDHAAPIIASTYLKGIRDFDVATAYEAMYKSATQAATDHTYEGRRGIEYYQRFGYVPFGTYSPESPEVFAQHQTNGDNWHVGEDTVYDQSVARTAEFAYDDWSVAALAKLLGREDDYRRFLGRSFNYENVFDPATGFMRPRYASGNWLEPWSPELWTGFSEGNSWMFSWFVPHSVAGLVENMGGRETVVDRLDSFFEEFIQPTFFAPVSNYWHGNEPDQQAPYLYNYVGQPWKTQNLVREVMDQLYGPEQSGLSGNDDMGQLSAWYVLSAMGFHPTSPASTHYEIGSPLFERVTIHLDEQYYDSDRFVVEAPGASDENRYVQSATLGDESLDRSWFSHFELQQRDRLRLEMGPDPNKAWGSDPEAAPPSRAYIANLTLETENGTVTGRVGDEKGTPIPDARVFVRAENGTVSETEVQTDEAGEFSVRFDSQGEDDALWARFPGDRDHEGAIATTGDLPAPSVPAEQGVDETGRHGF